MSDPHYPPRLPAPKAAKTARKCPDCWTKANKPVIPPPDLTWLEWKKGSREAILHTEAAGTHGTEA